MQESNLFYAGFDRLVSKAVSTLQHACLQSPSYVDFTGPRSTVSAPAKTPPAKHGEQQHPLRSVFSLHPVFSHDEAPSNAWQTGGSALVEESKEAYDGLDDEVVDRRRVRGG
jgi:hypothetical protein